MKNKKMVLVIVIFAILMISFGFVYLIVFSNKETSSKKEKVEEKYQDERITKVLKKEDVKKSKNIITAKELYTMLSERGITDFTVEFVYDMDGALVEDLTIINNNSTEKYPMYFLSYKVPATENIWTITVIGNLITAFPKDKPDSNICLTESEEFMSYSPEENKLYYVVPNKEMFDIKVVDKIDAKTIAEEDSKLS